MKISAFFEIPSKINILLTRTHKIYLVILLIFTLLIALLETVGIAAIMPFITVASNPAVLDEGLFKTVFDFLGFESKSRFVILFGILLAVFYLFRMVFNITYTYLINKYSYGTQKHFSLVLLKTYFSIPYRNFVQKNSGELVHLVNYETQRLSVLLLNTMRIFSELFTALLIYTLMVIVNWRMTLVLSAILAVVILLMVTVLIKRTRIQGHKTTDAGIRKTQILHEAFGNLKFIKLRGNESVFLKNYDASAKTFMTANSISSTLGLLPQYTLENIGFSLLIGAVIYIFWRMDAPQSVIPIISMYALGLYRMLPAVNRMLLCLNTIAYNQNALDIVYNETKQETEKEGNDSIQFEKLIDIDSVCFKYNTGNEVLKDINLQINKGESLAITGESGTGKSTLVDLLIGVNKPDSGTIFVDGEKITNENIRSYRNKIGYIPQSIYLFDGTVAENVTFSAEFDEDRLVKTLKMANLWSFLEKNDGIHTLVGDGGIQLSGGQKQRVGIARALYTDPDILVLDEATSSLDNETEGRIMDEIYEVSENKTLVVIAHRLSTVERCKRHVVIEEGRIVE